MRGLQSRDTGLLKAGSVSDLADSRMDTILPNFQMLGMVLCSIEWLKMFVKALTATGSRCFKCLYVMPSGPAVEVDLVW